MTWAYEQDVEPTGAKFLLVTLANYANEAGQCFPGHKKLARETGQSERSVWQHLQTLEARGFIRRDVRRREDGTRTSDLYTLIGFLAWGDQLATSASSTTQPATSAGVTRNQRTINSQLSHDLLATVARQEPLVDPSGEPLEDPPDHARVRVRADKAPEPSTLSAPGKTPAPKKSPALAAYQRDVVAAYIETRGGQHDRRILNMQGGVASRLFEAGWTREDVADCGRWIQTQPFYTTRGWDLRTVEQKIAGWAVTRPAAAPSTTPSDQRRRERQAAWARVDAKAAAAGLIPNGVHPTDADDSAIIDIEDWSTIE